jgi:hypothetical protein
MAAGIGGMTLAAVLGALTHDCEDALLVPLQRGHRQRPISADVRRNPLASAGIRRSALASAGQRFVATT